MIGRGRDERSAAGRVPAGRVPAPSDARPRSTPQARLRVDPVACDGVGVCAHLAPSIIDLDRWGYPIVPTADLARGELAAAERAVQGCPRKALWIESVEVAATHARGGTTAH